uniref:Protein FIZZY-RELATED 3 n=1 Tax=Cajanus cajan TaxID=3821 RepID=A0A151RQC5_CAJCA|nr:Protein FIZZY-RELATED 3 [Cajanus cajan]
MLRFRTDHSAPPSSPYSPSVLGPHNAFASDSSTPPPKPPRKVPKTPHKASSSFFALGFFYQRLLFSIMLFPDFNMSQVLVLFKVGELVQVLDAPSLQDDFYLNLVDWSSQNVLAVGLGTCVYLWSASNSKVTKLCDLGPYDGVCSVQWTREGSFISIGTNLGQVQIWDGTQCKKVRTMGGHQTRTGVLAWNSRTLASGSRDRNILQHDMRVSSDFVSKLVGHKSEVCGLKWSCDDRELASGGNDNQLLVWNQHSQQPALRLTEHTAAVKAIAWSPHQSGLLVSGGGTADRCIRFWNTTNGHQLNSVDTGSQVCNLAWSKNVNELVSTHGYSQNQIMVWKYPSLAKVATLTGHSMRVLYLAMSPDGQTIVTGAGDETLRFWNVFPSMKAPAPVKDTGLWSLGRTQIR